MCFHPRNKTYPTILLFRTGSYTLMGGKSFDAIKKSESFVKMLVQKFITINYNKTNCV
jgi:TATA-box binding protein (TBP) (component of TFIID and TFIIIB)